ncbi:MAG: patatin-like phospholipase family protein [Bacteroidales bacterium]|nr:patatin-like phospholipase family protein [Bacteroidales bacterium]
MKRILLLLTLVLALLPLRGQQRRLRYGIDPVSDSLALREIRARMDRIRAHRPTVAVVLSGGGAKGLAHIGVMQYIDSLKIPVDLIVGTSMGGLIGGMYAVGYNQHEVDSITSSFDWGLSLSDRLPRSYMNYNINRYNEKYVLSFPFYYSRRNETALTERRYADLHLGAESGTDVSEAVSKNLLGSLPSGFVYGQNVNNIFSALTVGYQDEMDFFDLPIPYVCVATEMVTSKEKVWTSGKLNTALRSTMSIPGLFTPVRTDGMVLLDGGMRNNYPTDLARRMGADFIIGVDLSSGFLDYEGLNNLGDILMQGIDMLGRSSYEDNVRKTEVTVKPDLSGYGMLSFDDAGPIKRQGYLAAVREGENLQALKELVGPDSLVLRARKAIDIGRTPVIVSGVEITGVTDAESQYLMKMLHIRAGQTLGQTQMEDAVATIYGTKAFDYVTYELLGKEAPYRLRFNCKKGPIHQFGIGGRFDSEEMIALLLNVGLNVHSIQGHALDLTLKVGTNPKADLHYYYMMKSGPTLNFKTGFRYVDRNQFMMGQNFTSALFKPFMVGSDNRLKTSYFNINAQAYVSNIKWKYFDLKLGANLDYFDIASIMAEKVSSEYDVNAFSNVYTSVFLDGRADSFDVAYYPHSGWQAAFEYRWVFAGLRQKIQPFHSFKLDTKGVAVSAGPFAMLPFVNLRILLGEDIPLPFVNTVGGRIAGRYLDYQIPFIGVNYAYALPQVVGVAGTDLRFKLFKNNFLSGIVNAGYCSSSLRNLLKKEESSAFIGAGLEYAYNSVVGPIRLNLSWSSLTRAVGAYVGIGFDF